MLNEELKHIVQCWKGKRRCKVVEGVKSNGFKKDAFKVFLICSFANTKNFNTYDLIIRIIIKNDTWLYFLGIYDR